MKMMDDESIQKSEGKVQYFGGGRGGSNVGDYNWVVYIPLTIWQTSYSSLLSWRVCEGYSTSSIDNTSS